MIRPNWFPAALALVALGLPASVHAHGSAHAHPAVHAAGHAYAFDDDDDFSWAIVSDHGQSMSGRLDSDLIEDLKGRYEEPFLLIGEKNDRYVITDQALVERAQEAAREIQKYGKEIGEIARTQARLSLGDARLDKRQAKLEKKRKFLEKSIRDGERRGESTDDLERDLFRVKVALDALEGVERSFELTSEERGDLSERRDVAKKRLQRGVERIKREMREILDTAKSRHLAEPVD